MHLFVTRRQFIQSSYGGIRYNRYLFALVLNSFDKIPYRYRCVIVASEIGVRTLLPPD